jgi:hypothetical protein
LTTKKIVLLIISRDIDLEPLNNSPRFLSYQFFSLPVIQYLEDSSPRMPVGQLLQPLVEMIEEVKPSFLLAHLGLAFERYPVRFLTAIFEAYALYPTMRIGMDRNLEYILERLNSVDADSEKMKLFDTLAQNQSIFAMNNETVHLVSCLR